ncbi:MAG: hypothetical protein LT071_13795 [Nocardioides sp.]|nr:hypothetical protein [Nocardioides sp.]
MSWETTTPAPGPSGPREPIELAETGPAQHLDAHVVARLADVLPPWAWARWSARRALLLDTPGTVAGARHRSCLRMVTEAFHPDLVEECHELGTHLARATERVRRESWVFRQWLLHERGALAAWLEVHAERSVRPRLDLARHWVQAPMGGHRLGGRADGRQRVFDLAGQRWCDVLDLGADAAGEGWVIGRLVSSSEPGVRVFDQAPLPVPSAVAHRVARAEPGAWLGVLADAVCCGSLDPGDLLLAQGSSFTDVPALSRSAARRLLRLAVSGTVPPQDAALVAAALLAVRGDLHAAERHLLTTGWAHLLPEPARALLVRGPTVAGQAQRGDDVSGSAGRRGGRPAR